MGLIEVKSNMDTLENIDPINTILRLFSALLMTVIVYMLKIAAEQADIVVIISNSPYKKKSKQ